MNFGVLFEKIADKDFPSGYFYAHVPSLGLTTHGLGIEGARGGGGFGQTLARRNEGQPRDALRLN